jgi:hypothetical protein
MAQSIEEMKNQAREYIKLTQTNSVKLAGTIVSNYQSEPKPRLKDNLPVMDDQGNQQFYAPRSSCKVSFNGGEVEIPLTTEQFNTLKVGEMYLFSGRLGLVKSFGSESVSYVFSTIEEL